MKELAFRGKIEGMIAACMNCADCLSGISHKHFAGVGGGRGWGARGWGEGFPDEQLHRSQSVNKNTAEREIKEQDIYTLES